MNVLWVRFLTGVSSLGLGQGPGWAWQKGPPPILQGLGTQAGLHRSFIAANEKRARLFRLAVLISNPACGCVFWTTLQGCLRQAGLSCYADRVPSPLRSVMFATRERFHLPWASTTVFHTHTLPTQPPQPFLSAGLLSWTSHLIKTWFSH